ncbi:MULTISPECIES: SDR family oxidoreductase [unclassified Colwellia]|uniref:SDR family oxidoreductase n=1 Tax=unclassified Colwellia TaxID=196834 RepID=UPI001C715938|nr:MULTISPECIES: SDR family oxidoreductase [unclassified Colwellia]
MTNKFSNTMTNNNILLTGATGGIGQAFSQLLFSSGANLVLVGRNQAKLAQLKAELLAANPEAKNSVVSFVVDILQPAQRDDLIAQLALLPFEVNVLINNAGVSQFKLFEQASESEISHIMTTNTIAPMQLTQALLPLLKQCDKAQIINIGSTYGSIGFPGYTAYCASKFALRGFSQTLSRELADSNIRVKYLAPRATQTSLNTSEVEKLNAELNSAVDSAETVAKELLTLIMQSSEERYIGWPEKLFVRINQLFPSLVSQSIIKQLPIIKKYANSSSV